MKNSKKLLAILLVVCLLISSIALGSVSVGAVAETEFENDNDLLMWYTTSARHTPLSTSPGAGTMGEGENNIWQQATLPLGNGHMGATVYGEVAEEEIQLNEESLWSGGPSDTRAEEYNGGNLEGKYQVWQQIVNAFKSGNDAQAKSLCDSLVGANSGDDGYASGYGSFQPFGKLKIDFGFDESQVTNYVRSLNLKTAVSTVEFDYKGVHYTREYFISNPGNVMVVKLSASKHRSITCTTKLISDQGATASAKGDTITIKGALTDNQLKYNGQVKVVAEGGSYEAVGGNIEVSKANSVTMYLSLATDYEDVYPDYRTDETDEQVNARVAKCVTDAATKGYDKVLAEHLKDYQGLFGRVELDIGQIPSDRPTNELLNAYKSNSISTALRRDLEVMLFQYGRYLTIASSRKDGLPSNLQGVWNIANRPPWHSDYHMNVNLQMNYWPVYSTNLAECATPLVDYVDALREPGRVTAEKYFGIASDEGEENGFSAHTQNTIYGWTGPGWNFSWGWSPAAVPWILQNCFEYYEYTSDEDYLRKNIYPMLLEESRLYDEILEWDGGDEDVAENTEGGRWVTAPAYSPEHGPATFGNTYESTLVWQLFTDTLKAAEVLKDDANDELLDSIAEKLEHLDPIEVGDSHQIKEWFGDEEGELGKTASGDDISGYDRNHRHISHLLGLFPGDLIETKKEWMDAAKVSMDNRPDQTTGWGMGHRINLWARLRDGDHALDLVEYLFGSGIYPNLWDAHAPFQIDGNFGMTSGVAEMLLQSNMDCVDILPALPGDWKNGSYSGLVARGDFEVSTEWLYGTAVNVEITSKDGNECVVKYDKFDADANPSVTDSKGETVKSEYDETKKTLTFATTKDETYTISGFEPVTPDAPENVKADVYRDNSVGVSWDSLKGVDYTVTRVDAEGNEEVVYEGESVDKFVDKLDEGEVATQYEYKVKASVNGTESKETEVTPIPFGTMVEIDREGMHATACSQFSDQVGEDIDGAADSVLDGNENTHWHTHWRNDTQLGGDGNHHWIEIDLNGNKNLSAISYLPRQTGGDGSKNGRILSCTVSITTPDDQTEIVKENVELADDASEKTIIFDAPVLAKKVKIQVLDAVGTSTGMHATAAEIRFYVNELVKLGDVDANGTIDSRDVTKLQKELVHYDVPDYHEPYADADLNGKINVKDATKLQKAIVGLVELVDDNPYAPQD